MKISFCTTVMNRLYHLKETLPSNLNDCLDETDAEFIILDYNSDDGLNDWMVENFSKFEQKVKYFHTTEPQFYNRSHSRNMVFRLANGDIFINLDADNFIGKGFCQFIKSTFKKDINCYICPNPDALSDTFGKIAFAKEDFYAINGYDESIEDYGFEDIDFKNRIRALGKTEVNFDDDAFLKVITHSTAERIQNERSFNTIAQIFVKKTSFYQSQLHFVYTDGTFESVEVKDCLFNFESKQDKTIKTIDILNRYVIIPDSTKTGIYRSDDFIDLQEIKNETLRIDLIHFYSQLKNKNKYFENQSVSDKIVNPNGFGCGIVYKNFDYKNPITLL